MSTRTLSLRACATIVAGLLAGCAVGPDYQRPKVATPERFKEIGDWKPAAPADLEPRGKWWEIFGDSELNALAERIETANLDVAVAEANYRQARAAAALARAALFPVVTAGASTTRSDAGSRSGNSGITTSHVLDLDASWEIDLWGRLRRSLESGVAGANASAGDLAATKLSAQTALVQRAGACSTRVSRRSRPRCNSHATATPPVSPRNPT